jgi:hypothetical protein
MSLVPSGYSAGSDQPAQGWSLVAVYQVRMTVLISPNPHLLASHPQLARDRTEGVFQEMGCCCCSILELVLETTALSVPFCRDDLDVCPAFVISGKFYIPDNWK